MIGVLNLPRITPPSRRPARIPGARAGFGSRFAVILSGELLQSLFHFVLNRILAEITGLIARGRTQAPARIVVRSTAVIAAGCLACGAAMGVLRPVIGHRLFGDRFALEPMNGTGLCVWAAVTVSLLYAIPRAYLGASAAFRTVAWGAIVAACVGFAIMIPLPLTLPAPTAPIGLVASGIACVVWSARAFAGPVRNAATPPDLLPARETRA